MYFVVFPYGRPFSLSKCTGKNVMPREHTLAPTLGLVAACSIVWWVRPYIASDAVFIMIISIFFAVPHKRNFDVYLERQFEGVNLTP